MEVLYGDDLEAIKEYLKIHPEDLNREFQWKTPIVIAAAKGHYEHVKYFLDVGAFPGYAFHKAAQYGHCDIVQLFVNRGFNLDRSVKGYHTSYPPLHYAIDDNQLDTMQILLNAGAPIDGDYITNIFMKAHMETIHRVMPYLSMELCLTDPTFTFENLFLMKGSRESKDKWKRIEMVIPYLSSVINNELERKCKTHFGNKINTTILGALIEMCIDDDDILTGCKLLLNHNADPNLIHEDTKKFLLGEETAKSILVLLRQYGAEF